MAQTADAAPDRRKMLLELARAGGAGVSLAGAAWWLGQRSHRPEEPHAVIVKHDFTVAREASLADMAVVQGDSPRLLARRAIDELGGIRSFISRGDVVVLKPNAGWDRTP